MPLAIAGAASLTAQKINFVLPSPTTTSVEAGSKWIFNATGGGSGNVVVLTLDPSSDPDCVFTYYPPTATYNQSSAIIVVPNHPGSCTIDANQAGNTTYAAASQVQQVFTVQMYSQLVKFTSPIRTLRIGTTYQLTTTKGGSGNPVIFSTLVIGGAHATSGCTVNETSGLITVNSPVGWCEIEARQAGGGYYLASDVTSEVFNVVLGAPGAKAPATSLTIFYGDSTKLSTNCKDELNAFALTMKKENLKFVKLEGYSNMTTSFQASMIASRRQVGREFAYLKNRLIALHVTGVTFGVLADGARSSMVLPPSSIKNRRTVITASLRD